MRLVFHISSVVSPLKLQTLAQFQAAIRLHLDQDKQTKVQEQVFSVVECEEDVDVDSDDTLNHESDEETSWSEEDDLILDVTKRGTATMLLREEAIVCKSQGPRCSRARQVDGGGGG